MRLVTFDVTGTLLKFRASPGQLYANVASRYDIKCDVDHLNEALKVNYQKIDKRYPNFGLHSGIGWQKWWHKVVHETFRDSKCNANDDTLFKVAKELISIFTTPVCWEHTSGTIEILNTLKEKNICIGIISNYDTRLPDLLKNMLLYDYFNFVLYSYDVGVEKPNLKIFERALEISNLPAIEPCEALHIGNSFAADYCGACNAGWNAALIAKDNKNYPNVPSKNIFLNLHDINQHLIQKNKNFSFQ